MLLAHTERDTEVMCTEMVKYMYRITNLSVMLRARAEQAAKDAEMQHCTIVTHCHELWQVVMLNLCACLYQ